MSGLASGVCSCWALALPGPVVPWVIQGQGCCRRHQLLWGLLLMVQASGCHQVVCPGPLQPTLSHSDEPGISALCKSLGVFSRCDPSSPYIHPVGWCQEHGKPLTPPQGESVAWECSLCWHIPLGTGFPGWHGESGGANPMALACLR